ncbi:vitellogenin-4-like [Ixodes scapularis]|uniref:vitellogenin-4-like n=1 Tax=Ixodes scapularis TaxID=6945 RepID=UPI001A9D3DD7|nr:vitellogenin-4-like [Ixodes scapularis]
MSIRKTSYEVGKDYVYHYNGKLQVQNPEQPLQSSGFVFRSKVIAQPSPDHTHFKIIDFEVDSFNGEHIQLSEQEFHYHSTDALKQFIERPFAGKFSKGKLVAAELGKNEPKWSKNLKKGVVSVFQLDLVNGRHDNPNAKQFYVKEESPLGNCDTLYIVGENEGDLRVTKIKNLKKCDEQIYTIGRVKGHNCVDCKALETHPGLATSQIQYSLDGTPEHYVINHASATSATQFKHFGAGNTVRVQINRTLELEEVRGATTDVRLPEDIEKVDHLWLSFPESGGADSLEELKEVNRFVADYEFTADKDRFIAALNYLVSIEYGDGDIRDVDSKEIGNNFLALHSSFAAMPFEDVAQMYDQTVANAPEASKSDVRRLFLDLLSATGGNPHAAFGMQLIKENKLSDDESEHFLSKLALHLKENSPALLTELASVCEHVKPRRHVWVNCQLALSSLAGQKGCVRAKINKEHDNGFCKPSLVSHFFNYSITPSDKKDQPEYKRTVYIKTAGNLATRSAVLYLERYISPEANQPEFRRAAAFWALKQSVPHHPEMVRDIALPVYMNKSESSYLRIAAFVNVLLTNPDLYLLKYIGQNIIDDPSDQVASYVTIRFRALVNSKYPCHQELAQHLAHVVPMWNNVDRFSEPLDRTQSQFTLSTSYDPKYDYGSATAFGLVRADDSYLPRGVYLGVQDYFGGHSSNTVSLTFENWGLDKLLNRVLGPHPGSTTNMWNVFGRRRFTRDASVKEIKEVEDALPVRDREHDHVYGRLSLDLFGHAIDTWEFDESIVQELTEGDDTPGRKLRNLLGKVQRKRSFSLSKDLLYGIPTELGVPIYIEHKQAECTYINRKTFSVNQADDAKFSLDFKRHYVHQSQGYSVVGVNLAFNKTFLAVGANVQTLFNLPINLHVTVDTVHKRMSLKHPLSLPWNVMNHHFRPYTFVKQYGLATDASTTAPYLSQYPVYNNHEVTEFDRTYFADIFGYGLNVKGSLLSKGLKKGLQNFWHESDYRQKYFYATQNPEGHPRELQFTLVPAEGDATTEIQVDLGYNFLEPNSARNSHFPVHDNVGEDGQVPSTHVLNLDYALKGSKERKMSAELRYSFTKDNFRHKVQFFYDRTPFHPEEKDHTKVCLDVTAMFPEPDRARLNNLSLFYEGKKLESQLYLRYGKNCVDQSSIIFKSKHTHTDDEAKQIRENAEGQPLGNNRLKMYKLRRLFTKCTEDQRRGVPLNFCMKYMYHSSRLGKFATEVEYKILKPLFPTLLGHQMTTDPHGSFLGTLASHIHGPNGKLHVVSQVPPVEEYSDIVVTTEDGHSFHHEHVPIYSHLLAPRVFSLLGYSNMANYISYYKPRYCGLQGKGVTTFDDVVVNLPETDCFKVVAKDCTPHKRFAVLARATGDAKHPKALKVFIQSTKVDLFPVSHGARLEFHIDGNRVPLTPGVPYSHTTHEVELFTITQADKFYEVTSLPYGLFLGFDGNILLVQTANIYRGKLCGLCGDYNHERQHELVGPDLHHYNDTLEFAKSYVVPSPDCTPP